MKLPRGSSRASPLPHPSQRSWVSSLGALTKPGLRAAGRWARGRWGAQDTPKPQTQMPQEREATSYPLQGHHLEKVPPPVPPHVPLLATAATSRLHRGAVDLEVGPLTPRSCPRPHPLFDLSSHGHECLLDIGSVLGTCLQEGDAQRIRKLLTRREERRRGEGGVRGSRPQPTLGGPTQAPPTLAVVLSTTFLVVRSLLLPTRSLLTFSLA